MGFNYHNMEDELVNTVMENEEMSAMQKQALGTYEETEDDEEPPKKSPIKFALAFVALAAIAVGGIWGLLTIPTDYVYSQSEESYQKCLFAMADLDLQTANSIADELLKEDGSNLQYLALKATISEDLEDADAQKDALLRIIKEDEDNYPAYEKLLGLYLAENDQSGISVLLDKAPNASIADLLKDYLVDAPVFSVEPGVYSTQQELEIRYPDNLNVYYTLDGSSPIENGRLYFNPILLEEGITTVNAVCCNENGTYSEVLSGEYQIGDVASQGTGVQIAQPAVYPSSGTYTTSQMITIDVPIGYKAYYSWTAGSELTAENGILYTGGIPMQEGTSTLSVIVVDESGNSSQIKQLQYTYQP